MSSPLPKWNALWEEHNEGNSRSQYQRAQAKRFSWFPVPCDRNWFKEKYKTRINQESELTTSAEAEDGTIAQATQQLAQPPQSSQRIPNGSSRTRRGRGRQRGRVRGGR